MISHATTKALLRFVCGSSRTIGISLSRSRPISLKMRSSTFGYRKNVGPRSNRNPSASIAEHRPPNHDPAVPWDPMVDFALMNRNVQGLMSLFHSAKPVVCKVHGFCAPMK